MRKRKNSLNGFRIATLLLCVGLATGAGCRSTVPVAPVHPPETEPLTTNVETQGVALADTPVIRAGHVVSVRVMSRNRVEVDEKALRVSGSGHITLPLLRDVQLAGLTLEKAKDTLLDRYGQYILGPTVSIDFVVSDKQAEVDSPWGYVTVLGRVKKPGQVSIPPTGRLTVTAAIQAVGGTDVGARTSNVQVASRSPEGEQRSLQVDLHGVDKENRPGGGLLLRNEDVVFVPEGLF